MPLVTRRFFKDAVVCADKVVGVARAWPPTNNPRWRRRAGSPPACICRRCRRVDGRNFPPGSARGHTRNFIYVAVEREIVESVIDVADADAGGVASNQVCKRANCGGGLRGEEAVGIKADRSRAAIQSGRQMRPRVVGQCRFDIGKVAAGVGDVKTEGIVSLHSKL